MTISSVVSANSYTGTGTTGPFAFSYRILSATDLLVTKKSSVSGAETTLAYPADYSVSGVLEAGGSITTTAIVAAGDVIRIRRKPPLTQPTSIRNQGTYFPSVIEDEFDRLVMQLQDHEDRLSKTFRLKETQDASLWNLSLSGGSPGQVLGLDGTGLGLSWLTQISAASLAVFGIYKASDQPGVDNTGVADSSAALNVLSAVTIPAAGGTVLWTPGTYKVGSNVIFGTNVQHIFLKGAKLSISTGVTVFFQGLFTAGLYQIFICNGTGNVDIGPGRQAGLLPEWWGAAGDGVTNDFAALTKCFSAANTTVSTSTPVNGILTGSITPILLSAPEYVTNAPIACSAYQIIRSFFRSRLRSSVSTTNILNMANCFRAEVHGIEFVGGFNAIQFFNNNTDTTRLIIRDCRFHVTTDKAIRIGGSGSAGGGVAVNSSIATLAATTTGFTRASGSFITDGFVNGMWLTPSGFSDNQISLITNVTALAITVAEPRLAEGSAAGRNLEGTYQFDTQSCTVQVEGCDFYYCHSIVQSHADHVTLKDCTAYLSANLTPANTAQIINYGFGMSLDRFFGVPFGASTPVASRWIDNYTRIWIKDPRFGAENGGIPAVWHRGPPTASSTDAQGTVVSITGGFATGGTTNPQPGLLIFREHMPEMVRIEAVRGLGSNAVIAEGSASVYAANITTATEMATYSAGIGVYNRYRYTLDGNLIVAPFAYPAALNQLLTRRWDQMLVETLMTGRLALVSGAATGIIDVTLDNTNDDSVAIHINYKVEDLASGANHSIEAGSVDFVANRTGAAVYNGSAVKNPAAPPQVMALALTLATAFTIGVVGNVVTLKVTSTMSNADATVITFRARIMPGTRSGTSVATATGVVWDQAGS